jgi:hypothetical protein
LSLFAHLRIGDEGWDSPITGSRRSEHNHKSSPVIDSNCFLIRGLSYVGTEGIYPITFEGRASFPVQVTGSISFAGFFNFKVFINLLLFRKITGLLFYNAR